MESLAPREGKRPESRKPGPEGRRSAQPDAELSKSFEECRNHKNPTCRPTLFFTCASGGTRLPYRRTERALTGLQSAPLPNSLGALTVRGTQSHREHTRLFRVENCRPESVNRHVGEEGSHSWFLIGICNCNMQVSSKISLSVYVPSGKKKANISSCNRAPYIVSSVV